jgi:DNA polymerase-3 subunit alpha
METHGKKLTLTIPLNDLKDEKINSLKNLVKTHKGEKQLFFVVYENEEKIHLTMPSRKHKINISKELLDELEREQLSYKLN